MARRELLALVALWAATACDQGRPSGGSPPVVAGPDSAARARVTEFWKRYRGATDQRIAGNTEVAAREYRRALELNPRHGDALYYLGGMRLSLGDFAGAEQAWRDLATSDPSSARAHSQLGRLYLCLDEGAPFRVDSAEAHLTRAHQINSEETGPVLQLGEAALIRGDTAVAARWFRTVLGSHQASAAAWFYAGFLEWKAGNRAKAGACYREALRVSAPASPPASAAPGEGDTKGGPPMTSRPGRCDQFRQLTVALDRPPGMEPRYGRLDSLLRVAGRRQAPAP